MTDHLEPDDDLLAELSSLDPTVADAPPEAGSTRYLSILEHAMTAPEPSTSPTDPATAPSAPTEPDITARTRRRRRRLGFAIAAAAAVALVVGIAVVAPGSDPAPASAAEALAQAAATTGDATTLRIAATYERPEGTTALEGISDGTDYRLDFVRQTPDGTESRETTVVIGDTVWEDGTSRTAPPEERNAAFAPSSEAVVQAILDGSTLEDLGEEDVRGTTARHIRATLTPTSRDALRSLSPTQVAMFELEYPDGVDTIDLWIADDLIRRIQIPLDQGLGEDGQPQEELATIEFYDFGADVDIAPPS